MSLQLDVPIGNERSAIAPAVAEVSHLATSNSKLQKRPVPKTKRWINRTVILLVSILAVAVMVYPQAAAWFSARAQSSSIDAYAQELESVSASEQDALVQRAVEYNRGLPRGPLLDPYSFALEDAGSAQDSLTQAYLGELKVPGTDVMARIDVPTARIHLPVYHGTGSTALGKGAGHLFGSSLPVGGLGTHTVISAHSGLPNSKMFTDLSLVKQGDVFTVSVLNEVLHYRVEKISVVLPTDLSELSIVPGKDYVTFLTCTPVNVNTHRLLVRGERISEDEAKKAQLVSHDGSEYPWWIFISIGAIAGMACMLFWPRRPNGAGRTEGKNE